MGRGGEKGLLKVTGTVPGTYVCISFRNQEMGIFIFCFYYQCSFILEHIGMSENFSGNSFQHAELRSIGIFFISLTVSEK